MERPSKWIEFKKKFYENFPEEDPQLLDFIAVYDILKYTMEGYSIKDIAIMMEEDENYVEDVIIEFLKFGGYSITLEYSPLKQYLMIKNQYGVIAQHDFVTPCENFLEIKAKVEEFYERH